MKVLKPVIDNYVLFVIFHELNYFVCSSKFRCNRDSIFYGRLLKNRHLVHDMNYIGEANKHFKTPREAIRALRRGFERHHILEISCSKSKSFDAVDLDLCGGRGFIVSKCPS